MKHRLLHETGGLRTFAVVLDPGDETMACLDEFSRREGVDGAEITGIGAFSDAVLLYFDWERKKYREIPVNEQVEVASLIGDIGTAPDGGVPAVHVHLVLGRSDGGALAGHLGSGHVRPTLELVITETPAHLCRRKDAESGLNLISL